MYIILPWSHNITSKAWMQYSFHCMFCNASQYQIELQDPTAMAMACSDRGNRPPAERFVVATERTLICGRARASHSVSHPRPSEPWSFVAHSLNMPCVFFPAGTRILRGHAHRAWGSASMPVTAEAAASARTSAYHCRRSVVSVFAIIARIALPRGLDPLSASAVHLAKKSSISRYYYFYWYYLLVLIFVN